MDNHKFYLTRYITQKKLKILRLTELVCCVSCFALAVILFTIRLYFITKVLLMIVATMFLFLTLVDAIMFAQSRPIGHRTWIVFSVAAFHMFSLCGGFLVFLKRDTSKTLLQVTCAMNFFTGYVYILDCVLIVLQYHKWINRNLTRVAPMKVLVDKAISTCYLDVESEYSSRRSTPRFRTTMTTMRPRPYAVPSYGGTFSVSKDIPPLPTPDPLRILEGDTSRPKKRMYSTLVNAYQNIEGSGDFSTKFHKVEAIERGLFSAAFDTTYLQKSSLCYQYRVEISEPMGIFSKNWLHSLLTKFQFLRKISQSYSHEEEVQRIENLYEGTNEAKSSDAAGRETQLPKEMIIAPASGAQGRIEPIPMQDSIFHHYTQQQCARCGKTHYQHQTTVHGTLQVSPPICGPCNKAHSLMQSPCGSQNCPFAQEIRGPGRTSNYSFKRNGLQQEYASRKRCDIPPERNHTCPPCGRFYYPSEEQRTNNSFCVQECKMRNRTGPEEPCVVKDFGSQHRGVECRCYCGGGSGVITNGECRNCTAQTCTENCPLKNCGTMAVQETKDKDVQISHATHEYNPQTSETRMVSASFLSRLVRGHSKSESSRCSGKKHCHNDPMCKKCIEEGTTSTAPANSTDSEEPRSEAPPSEAIYERQCDCVRGQNREARPPPRDQHTKVRNSARHRSRKGPCCVCESSGDLYEPVRKPAPHEPSAASYHEAPRENTYEASEDTYIKATESKRSKGVKSSGDPYEPVRKPIPYEPSTISHREAPRENRYEAREHTYIKATDSKRSRGLESKAPTLASNSRELANEEPYKKSGAKYREETPESSEEPTNEELHGESVRDKYGACHKSCRGLPVDEIQDEPVEEPEFKQVRVASVEAVPIPPPEDPVSEDWCPKCCTGEKFASPKAAPPKKKGWNPFCKKKKKKI